MAVAAVMARRAAAAELETPKVASLPLVSQKQRPGSALSNRSAASSRPLRPVIVAAEPMAETPKPVHSEESDRDLKSGEPSVSKALTSYSRKEVDDQFQEILEEQGVADVMDEEEETPKVPLVERTEFESFIGIMIAINAVLMGFEVDLAQTGDVGWIVVENFFCILWISEMVLKMKTLHRQYFMNAYNLLDFALVLLAVAEAWVIPFLFIDGVSGLGVIRMVRILRMLRLLRLIRLMKLFKNLWLIIVGFRESLSTLFWVLMLLTVVIYVFAIFLRYTLNCFGAFREWDDCAEYFGSMPAAMYTLFQVITLESWSQVFARPILKVQPAFFIVFLLFLFLTTFGILNIIVGVIVENTLNAAKQNQELQERRLQRQLRQELESIRRLFEEADSDGSGTLERSEFVDILSDPTVQQTLTRMEVPVEDPGMLFEILDPSGTDSLSFPSFAQGVLRVKGPPTQLDMKTMQLGVANISRRVNKVEQYLDQHSAMLERNAVMLGILMTKLGCHDQMPPSVSGQNCLASHFETVRRAEAMASTGAMQEAYTGYDNSSYMGVYPQWQEQWNWGTDSTEYTTGEQFCGNVAFFVPFPGMVGGVPMTNTNTNTNTNQENVEAPQATTTKADLHEMEAKMAKLQAENQRLMQLCENERHMRQIEVSAKQQILEMYAVPRSEVEQLVRRFQEDSPTAMQMHYGETTTPFVSASNASTTAGSPGTNGSATSLESLLQDLYKKLYEPEDHEERENREEEQGRSRDWEANEASLPVTPEEEEELQQHLSHLQSLAGMEIDDRAKGSLLRMSPTQGKLALRKVEDIIQEQGGFCHNLSSMVQSVCRKMGHVSRQWA